MDYFLKRGAGVIQTPMVVRIMDSGQMNELYNKFFNPPYPARSTLQQNFEVNGEAAEQISFIAVRRQPAGTDEASR